MINVHNEKQAAKAKELIASNYNQAQLISLFVAKRFDGQDVPTIQELYPNEFGATEVEQEQQEDNSWVIAKERLTDYAVWHNDKLPKEEEMNK